MKEKREIRLQLFEFGLTPTTTCFVVSQKQHQRITWPPRIAEEQFLPVGRVLWNVMRINSPCKPKEKPTTCQCTYNHNHNNGLCFRVCTRCCTTFAHQSQGQLATIKKKTCTGLMYYKMEIVLDRKST